MPLDVGGTTLDDEDGEAGAYRDSDNDEDLNV